MSRSMFLIPVLIIISIHCKPTFAQTTKIIWADEMSSPAKIQMCSKDGNYLTDIISDQNMPFSLAVDDRSTPPKVYFCEKGESRIKRINLDGTGEEDVITGIGGISDLELDLENRKIYWVRDTWDDDAVQRADMDGLNSNIEELYHSTSTSYGFYGIGLDCVNQKVYWTQAYSGCSDKIRRMNFDQTGFENVIVYPQNTLLNPWDIDVQGNKIYWTDCGLSEDIIYSANLDGSGIDTVIQEVDCQFFAIDSAESTIYWGDNNKIECANLDGTGRHDVVTGVGTFIMGIAVAHNVSVTTIESEKSLPSEFELFSNYPNPFNPKTTISYCLPEFSQVDLSIYNIRGQKVATLILAGQQAGIHKYEWEASGFNSGVYFCKLHTSNNFAQQKIVLLK